MPCRSKWRRHAASAMRSALAHPLCPSSAWITRIVAMVIIGALFLGTAVIVIGGNGWFQIVGAVVVAQVCAPPV